MTTTFLATDGSCLQNPGGATGWAWVSHDGHYHVAGAPTGTNQVAELWGVISALRDHPVGNLVVQVDSEYVLNIATKWAAAWERNGWRTRDGQPVKNLGLVKLLIRLMRQRDQAYTVEFRKVPGHDPQGRWPMNTVADTLAQQAAKTARTAKAEHKEFGVRAPFRGPLEPNTHAGDGSTPGDRCGSCDAVIRDVSPHCRCDQG